MNSAPKEPRILFLSLYYPPAFGGGGLFLSSLRRRIRVLGFSSEVVCGNRGIPRGAEAAVHRLPTPGGVRWPRLEAYSFALLTPAALITWRGRYDIIHTMGNAHSVYAAILTSRLLRKKIVVASIQNRQDDPGGIVKERFGRLKNRVFARADRFVCLNSLQVQTYHEAGYPEEKIRFIRNGIDGGRFSPCKSPEEKAELRRSLGLPPEGFVAASIGAIIHRKGMDLLVTGWSQFRKDRRDGTLVLMGPHSSSDAGSGVSDSFVSELKQRLTASGVAGSVFFTGKVTNVPDYLRAADAFALMSRGEGFPLALLEAMSTGLPFLMWNLPDYGGYDLEDQVQGFLLPPFDTDLLARRLALLADQGDLGKRMGEAGRRLASQFDLTRSTMEHVQMYRELSRS